MANCGSELPQILSLASGALAINLAYLNLERFRYAKAVLNSARGVMDEVEKIEKTQDLNFKETVSYQQLKALVDFPKGNVKELGVSLKITRFLYGRLFVKPPADRIAGVFFVIASTAALVLGSGQPIGVLAWTCGLFVRDYISVSYWILVAGITFPMLFLMVGQLVQKTCHSLAERIKRDFGAIVQNSARAAVIAQPDSTIRATSDAHGRPGD